MDRRPLPKAQNISVVQRRGAALEVLTAVLLNQCKESSSGELVYTVRGPAAALGFRKHC